MTLNPQILDNGRILTGQLCEGPPAFAGQDASIGRKAGIDSIDRGIGSTLAQSTHGASQNPVEEAVGL